MIDLASRETQRELLESLPPQLRNFHVYIGGSLVEGYGNSTSDIDLICVAPTGVSAPSASDLRHLAHAYDLSADHVIHLSDYKGTRVDTEIASADAIETMFSTLKTGTLHPGTISSGQLTLLNNIFSGIPISEGGSAERWRESLGRTTWLACLAERCLSGYRGTTEDAQGAIQARNLWASQYSSQIALDFAIDALSASRGSTNMKPKWRIDRLTRLGLVSEANEYWDLTIIRSDDEASMFKQFRRRLVVAQRHAQNAAQVEF